MRRYSSARCCSWATAWDTRSSCHPAGPAGPAHSSITRDAMFAVGVLLHEMLTGEPPAVEGESLEEVRSLPPWLAELARRCLTPEPTARWPDAAAALDAVGRSGAGPM